MNWKMKSALVCYFLTILMGLFFAAIYLFRPEFMPYHAVAIGVKWTELRPEFQTLFLALLRVSGGGWLATAVSMGILVVIPFRRNEYWSRWAIPLIGLSAAIPTLYATLLVKARTPASVPWFGAAAAILLLIAGFVLSILAKKAATGPRL